MSGDPSPSTAIVAGCRFGRYLVHECIGRGGMGEVWLASAEGPGGFRKQLVLKTVRPDLAERSDLVAMLIREAALAARLNHPNVVQVFDLDRVDGTYFIAMEYVPGYTLTSVLRRAHAVGGALAPWMVACVGAACADGLHYAHELTDAAGRPLGLVHRDVSPGNIMIASTGNVTILDFGIAVSTEDERDDEGVLKGKFQYMPPEVVRGGAIDRRCDVYALGVVLYVGLTGEVPYPGLADSELLRAIVAGSPSPPSSRRAGVPRELERIAMTAMAHDPRHRHATAAALGAELRGWLREVGADTSAEAVARYIAALFTAAPGPLVTLAAGSQSSPLPGGLDDEADEEISIDVDDLLVVEDDGARWPRATTTPVAMADAIARLPTVTGAMDLGPLVARTVDALVADELAADARAVELLAAAGDDGSRDGGAGAGDAGDADAPWPWAVEDQPPTTPIVAPHLRRPRATGPAPAPPPVEATPIAADPADRPPVGPRPTGRDADPTDGRAAARATEAPLARGAFDVFAPAPRPAPRAATVFDGWSRKPPVDDGDEPAPPPRWPWSR